MLRGPGLKNAVLAVVAVISAMAVTFVARELFYGRPTSHSGAPREGRDSAGANSHVATDHVGARSPLWRAERRQHDDDSCCRSRGQGPL
jgi:hypothetical protein